ncbi:DUF5710 domain-containing protein [Microbispora sitophila]|uniref:DUF5710 domain-containing protein n=1 Tax=Microbispora sitophila TaxID=2771537 RepID=UPI001D026BCC|nr:DUF5710 domain-containing protein [Microbispora sitophila]
MERPARPWPQRGFSGLSGPRPDGDGEPRPGAVVGGRLYLDVPFEDKDELKRLTRAEGMPASWDGRRKLWHVDADIPRHVVRRWLPPSSA